MDRPESERSEPQPTRFDLRGRLFGTPIRIHPFFWPAAYALGWPIFADPDQGSFGFLFLWVFCVLISLLIHEFGHVIMARCFGVRLQMVLHGLGSLTIGMDALPRRLQRLAVRFAGPAAQLLVFAGLFAIPPEVVRGWIGNHLWADAMVGRTVEYLILINIAWPLLNLLPIWPLDGGWIALELCQGLFGRRGPIVALGLCILVAAVLALWTGQKTWLMLAYRFDPSRAVVLQNYTVLLLFSVFFIVSAVRALLAELRHGHNLPAGASR